MKIQFNPQTYPSYNNKKTLITKQQQQNPQRSNSVSYNPITYKDFNISFGARTPEDFYEFNAQSMPYSMRNYLNYDKENRKHIPPEQMMNVVFKHLDNAKDFEEVKSKYYPKEDLFNNLHPLRKNARKGILSEIKVARDLSDTPLLKDGSDDFGMYLLKKIYKEGKTLKEISKDFLEKDINEEYKGFITEPVTYDTTGAYGIKFPNIGFWHSFIATRDEYKKFFVTLPKNMVDPNRTEANQKSDTSSQRTKTTKTDEPTTKRAPRKYTLKKYQKDQIKNDIKKTNGNIDSETVEKAVRRRFSKDDPEAYFIIKYLSPIMTVAADKVHLSEEMRYFYEFDPNPTTKRFWNDNRELLDNYSTAITDTMELFEDVYGAGGLIPINNNYEQITSKTENQKPIDFVTTDFIELLDYTQTIKPNRDKRYAEHDEMQKQWEEHFLERYGEVQEETTPKKPLDNQTIETTFEEVLAKNPTAQMFKFNVCDTDIRVAIDLKEIFEKSIMQDEHPNTPKSYCEKFKKFALNHPKMTENILLGYAINVKDLLQDSVFFPDNVVRTEEEQELFNKNVKAEIKAQLPSQDEIFDVLTEIHQDFEKKYPQFIKRVKQAIREYSTTLKAPSKEYLKTLVQERIRTLEDAGLVDENVSEEEKAETTARMYERVSENIRNMKNHIIGYMDINELEAGIWFLKIGKDKENTAEIMDNILQKYNTPLTNKEKISILNKFFNIMVNMNPENTEYFKTPEISRNFKLTMNGLKLKENAKIKKNIIEVISKNVITNDNTTLRYLLDKNGDKNLQEAIVETEIIPIFNNDNLKLLAKVTNHDL